MTECKNRFKVSETLIVEVDIGTNDDISVVQVVRFTNNKYEVLNTIYGEDAEILYKHLVDHTLKRKLREMYDVNGQTIII
jgi:hypothetical protein